MNKTKVVKCEIGNIAMLDCNNKAVRYGHGSKLCRKHHKMLSEDLENQRKNRQLTKGGERV